MKVEKVSVVMCTYNGDKFLREQLESIVNQTYPIYELIIQDDCSLDNTMSILNEYSKKYHFIKIYRNTRQKGINENFFSAMTRATGDYIAISDQDDIWELNKLDSQMKVIDDNLLCFCFSVPFSDTVKVNPDLRIPNYRIERMLYISAIPGHTMLFKRYLVSLIPDIQRFSYIFVYDFLIQLVAASYDSISFCPDTKVNHRRYIDAASYTPVENYSKSILNLLYNVKRTFVLYRELRPEIKQRLSDIHKFLLLLPDQSSSKRNAIKLIKNHIGDSIINILLMEIYCVKYRNYLFYTKEKNFVLSVLRALYFPISCSDYFREKSKSYCKSL